MEAVISSTEFRIQTDQDPSKNGSLAVPSSSASAVFRKIEFHPARKPFSGFSNGSSDFKIETLNPSLTNNKPAFTAKSAKKPDSSDQSEHGLDPDLTFTITFRKIGAGLQNLGNTCFLNSVLQCLTYTEPLAAYLEKVGHEKRCQVAGFCALCAMQKHVRTARQATGRILAPKDLVSNLRCVSRNFRNCRQEDAHEYMINLLECMHKCGLPSGVPSESSDAYRSSLVHKIFGGSLRSQVKCEQCSHCSNKFDPFLDLSLDISKADSLQRALLRYTAVELLDDGAKVYQCERCKQKVKAKKQLTVSKAPSVLTIHLKRFEAHRSAKIDRKVQFTSAIDMKPFVSDSNEGNLKYTLYGVLVHYGHSIHSGHYACFVRTSTGMWYSLDDNRVFQVSEKTVFDQKAYMLFYVRDRQSAVPKNTVTVAKKETPKGSLAKNKAPLIISSNKNDQVNGLTAIKACGSKAIVANGTSPLNLGAPVVLTQKDLSAKETKPSSVEPKETLKRENGSAPLKSCDLGASAILSQKDLITKETLQKEVPLPQDSGEGSCVKENSKAVCAILPGKAVNQTSVPHLEEPATLIESVKATSDGATLTTPSKTRKRKMKTPQVGLTFFKLNLGIRIKKIQKRGRSSTLAVKGVSETLLSKSRAPDQENVSEVASGSASLHEKDESVSTKIRSNEKMLLGSPTDALKERTNQNGAVLASSDQQQPLTSSDSSEASKNAKRKRESSKEEPISLQKEQVTILTRGLPEPVVVAKWDEEVPVSQKMEKKEAMKIGYVADEWDEEYDRGKTKKIRLKEDKYEGPNPFQLIASRKQKETKKWTQRLDTAKTAVRI